VADLRRPPVPALLGLAVWALLDAALHGSPGRGLAPALLAAGIVAVFAVCRRLPDASREILLSGIIATAVVVAATGWLGVAFRLGQWRWEAQGVWRASSALTYPNATAIVLVMVTLLVLALLTERGRSLPLALAATALLIGTGATLSRAGLIALLAGGLLLLALAGPWKVVRVTIGPVVGAAVALSGLVPSMAATAGVSPVWAVAGLIAGLTIGGGLASLGPRGAAAVVSAACLCGVLAVVAFGPDRLADAADHVAGVRLTLDSPERFEATRVALDRFAERPLIGGGPGLIEWRWGHANGAGTTVRYVHNEYVQLTAELGLVGAGLLAAALLTLGWGLWKWRNAGASRPLWAGVVAGICAFAVHSASDFVWHIPAIPLMAAALVGLVLPLPSAAPDSSIQPETDKELL
ncbi:MAG TPA: O-antigen ligase family protein, partial [Acidimicrobiales bacterium]|nr:O-antigen ligase family protein [Acidimicrobiales bacterium]